LTVTGAVYAAVRKVTPLDSALPFGAGLAVVPGLVAAVTFLVRHRPARGRSGYGPAVAAGSLVLLFSLAGLQPQEPDPATAAPGIAQLSGGPDVRVVISRQPSEGVRQVDLGPTFLKNLEGYLLERQNEIAARNGSANVGVSGAPFRSNGAVFMELDGHKFAVVRLAGPERTEQVWIVGIHGTELLRVGCIGPARVTVTAGPCGQAIEREFQVRLAD
jgi:hypothetical protein